MPTYQIHWGLRESPFRGCLDPQFFYQSPTHEEALARLQFLIEQHRRLGVLLGPAGSGKSFLLEVFARGLRHSGRPVAMLSLLGVGPAEMLWLLAAAFHLNPDPGESVAALWRAITDRLAEYRYQQFETVILLDDADRASRAVLNQATRLAQFDPSVEMQLTIVLAGRPEGMGRLGRPLLDMAELRIDIEPWEQADTADFLNSSLTRAGRRSSVFADPAIARLHELSHGIPRQVTQLADLSLLAGAGANLERIDADVVESVYHELGIVEASV